MTESSDYVVPMDRDAQPMQSSTARAIGFRELSPEEQSLIKDFRRVGDELATLLEETQNRGIRADREALQEARMHFKSGLMWAVRAITKPAFF